MTRILSFASPAVVLGTLVLACSTAPAAPLAAETRSPGDFHAVELRGTLEIDVKVGPATHVEVSADADVIAKVTTTVERGALIVDTKGIRNPEHKIKVTITTPALDAVTLAGTGRLAASGISAPSFAVAVQGTGQLDLAGATGDVVYQVQGTADVAGKDLAAKRATISMEGTSNMSVTASDALTVAIEGTGNVEAYGHPRSVTKSVSGVGRVVMR